MDVANSEHLVNKPTDNYFSDDDVTPEGVEFMRLRAAPSLSGETWIHIESKEHVKLSEWTADFAKVKPHDCPICNVGDKE